MTQLPRAMLIDMDDTILSAYGRPEIAWNIVATEFADELAPHSPREVAETILFEARKFWSTAEPRYGSRIVSRSIARMRRSCFRARMTRSMR